MGQELTTEIRRQRARALRYKQPLLPTLNIDCIRQWIWDAQETCDEWAFVSDDKKDELLNALDGDEDEWASYQMSFATLSNDLESLSTDIENGEVPESFDDIMVAIAGQAFEPMWGYDADAGDYYGLEDSFENLAAIDGAQRRLERYTKKQIIQLTSLCMKAALSYMALTVRLDTLAAAVEVLKNFNAEIVGDTKLINELFDDMMQGDPKATRKFDQIVNNLPEEAWCR